MFLEQINGKIIYLICRNFIRTLSQQSQECLVKCSLIPGDGVGPELVSAVQQVFDAAKVPVEFETLCFSEWDPEAKFDDVVESIAKNKVCLKGITASPEDSTTGELETLNIKFRKALDLYANVVHFKSLPNVPTRHEAVDFVVVREQTEGEYSALEHESVPGIVECLKIVTAVKSERIATFAFDYAMEMNRKKVTAVHKANIMKLGDGLFLRSCEKISKAYPSIVFENMIVDNCTMQTVSKPQQFDVMVTPNLYGNILINIGAGLVGGAGVVAGASYSKHCAVFEQGSRHAFHKAAGKNIANPTGILMASVNLLAHVNLLTYSETIRQAICKVLKDGQVKTKDLGGNNTTKEFTDAIIKNIC